MVMNLSNISPRKQRFEEIIAHGFWSDKESVCGRNSTYFYTKQLRHSLQLLFNADFISSFLDVGCSDCYWMSTMDLSKIRYTGIDVVTHFIRENQEKYGKDNIRFEELDIVDFVPAKHDMVFCRDVFTCLTLEDTVKAFNNIKKSGARFFAASGFYRDLVDIKNHKVIGDTMNSSKLPTGDFRAINFGLMPFFFPKPIITLFEDMKGKSIEIWQLDDVPYLEMEKIKDPAWCNPITADDFMKLEFFRKLCELPFVEKIQLFGSRALKKNRINSDIDLIIYLDEENRSQNWLKVTEILSQNNIPLKIDASLYATDFDARFSDSNPTSYAKTLYQRP